MTAAGTVVEDTIKEGTGPRYDKILPYSNVFVKESSLCGNYTRSMCWVISIFHWICFLKEIFF